MNGTGWIIGWTIGVGVGSFVAAALGAYWAFWRGYQRGVEWALATLEQIKAEVEREKDHGTSTGSGKADNL